FHGPTLPAITGHELEQPIEIERFAQNGCLRFCVDERSRHRRMSRHDDDRDEGELGIGAQSPAQLPPVHGGHHQVEQHETRVEVSSLNQCQRLLTVGGLRRPITLLLEQGPNDVAGIGIVVDDDDHAKVLLVLVRGGTLFLHLCPTGSRWHKPSLRFFPSVLHVPGPILGLSAHDRMDARSLSSDQGLMIESRVTPHARGSGDSWSVCRILVVDDDESIRETVRVFLSMLGHEVHEAKDGREALEWLAQNISRPPCLAVIDLRMPVLDGWDLPERMRLPPPWKDLPIGVLSATIARSAPPPVLSASDYWSKPLDFERVERIHQHCPEHAASWEV